ncbi:hypothetical protein ACFLTB_03770 [Chloroflexota bacterium]
MKYFRFLTLKRIPWLVLAALIICAFLISRNGKPIDNFIARDLKITPSEVSIGEKILVEFWIDINADRGVTTDVTLEIDGEAVQTRTVHAEADSSTRVYFQVTANETGRHTVSIHNIGIDELSAVFEVTGQW